MYTDRDYRTKRALKEDLAAGRRITVFQPGIGKAPVNGTVYLEGPHYPQPHTWYAEVQLVDGLIVKVK